MTAGVAGVLPASCREAPREVAYDLAMEAHVARQVHPGGERSYVTSPETIYSTGSGNLAKRQPSRLVSNAILEWAGPRPREVRLDVERPEWGSGDVALTLNHTPVGRLALEPGRRWYTASLPDTAQRVGANRLRLTFAGGETDEQPPPAGPPGRLLGLLIGSPVAPDPPPGVNATGQADPTLSLVTGTGLEFGIRLPEAAEIAFTPRARDQSPGPIMLRVALSRQGQPPRDLFRVELTAGENSGRVRVPIQGEVGDEALLGLFVDGPSGGVGEWVAPVVMGRSDPPAPTPGTPETMDRVSDLREDLGERSVLLLVLDAASARHFGCYGYERDTTPNIDRLATEGFLFERAYTVAPYTRLAMASLWTSQHPDQHHHGVRPRAPLPAHRVVLPELLERQGVRALGAIGNVVAGEVSGLNRGFTELRHIYRGDNTVPEAESVRRSVEDWMRETQDGRALFYGHFLEPHFPYAPPPPFDTRFGDVRIPRERYRDRGWFEGVKVGRTPMSDALLADVVRLYDGNLAYVDHEIGLLREHLEQEGLWDELVVVLTADHGEQFLEHGAFEHGWHLYDEIVKIPLVIRLPGQAGGQRLAEPVDIVDLGATLADVFGVLDDAAPEFAGRSLLPLLAGGGIAPRPIVTRDLTQRPAYSTFDGRLKLIHSPNWGRTELYDPGRDPDERHDLAAERPVTAELRRQELYRWLRDLERGEPGVETPMAVDNETQEALRALGYVN